MFHTLETVLLSYSTKMPLEAFAFIASMVEEIVAPIPSPVVMIVTGSLASIQGRAMYSLILLSLIGALGKLIGAVCVYYISDKVEDAFSGVLEKYFGVTHENIESFGKRLSGTWKDYIVMFLMRALPLIPSVIVSVGSGILKVPIIIYVVTTFFGSLVRDFLYAYFGYAGVSLLGNLINRSESISSVIQIIIFVLVGAGLAWAFYTRRKKVI